MPYHAITQAQWGKLSLYEQLGNVGSEVSRAIKWRDRDKKYFEMAIERALELLDFTIEDPRWKNRLKEICRAREFLCDAVCGDGRYHTTLEDLDRYFLQFALASRLHR